MPKREVFYVGDVCIDLRQMPEPVAARMERQLRRERVRLTPEQWQRLGKFIQGIIAAILAGLSGGGLMPTKVNLDLEEA